MKIPYLIHFYIYATSFAARPIILISLHPPFTVAQLEEKNELAIQLLHPLQIQSSSACL